MKILSLTMGSPRNLGDQVIQDVILRFFQQMTADITPGKFYPFDMEGEVSVNIQAEITIKKKQNIVKPILKKILFFRWVKAQYDCRKSKLNIRIQLDRYCGMNFKEQKFDVVLIGGGQFIKHNHDFIYCLQYWVEFFGCPIYLIGVGCDEYFSRREKKLYSRLLNNCKQVYVRDHFSMELMNKEFNVSTQFIPDVAFLYNTLFDVDQDGREDVQFISVYDFNTARDSFGFSDRKSYYEMWIVLIGKSINHASPIIFGASTEEDYLENEIFIEFYKEKFPEDNVQLYRTKTVKELVKLLTKSKTVYSARMHILILAVTVGVENLISFPISEKLKEFERMYIKRKDDLRATQKEVRNKLESIVRQEMTNEAIDDE